MLIWIACLILFGVPIGYLCLDLVEERRARAAKLERIRSRLQEKESEARVGAED
jgi:hypothetical protein